MTAVSTRVGHVGVNVTDIERAIGFYTEYLGLEVLSRSGAGDDRRYAFLGFDGSLATTLWEQAAGSFNQSAAGLHHLAFQVDDVAAVHAVEAKLREAGLEPLHGGAVPHSHGSSGAALYFTDPDGTRLEVYAGGDEVIEAAAPYGEAPSCGFF